MTTPSTARSSASPSDSLQRSSATSYPYAQRKHLPCASPKVSCSDAQQAAAPNSRSSMTTNPKSSACSPPATPPEKSAGASRSQRTPGTGTGNNETLTFVRRITYRCKVLPVTKTGLNVDGTGAERSAGHKNRPKRGRDRGRTQCRPQKPPETWTGPGQNARTATKTARNVDGTASERQAGHKNRPKRGRDRGRTPGQPQKPP